MPTPPPRRLAIITGAGSGLGRAFCLELVAAGDCRILATDVDEASGRETLALLREAAPGVECDFASLDVTNRAVWQALADRVTADIDAARAPASLLLVNNAGICAAGEVAASSPDQWRRILDVNFFGVLHGCQTFAPLLVRQAAAPRAAAPAPAIINVASVAGLFGAPSMGAYCASKAAAVALTESLYAELRPAGVGVTVVAPGFFRTGLLARGEFCSDRHRAQAEKLSRAARFTAADVARAALAASARRELYCVMGRRARWLWRAKRLAPRLMQRLVAREYHRTFGAS
jgi:NAD(P)-dependent dehydrogenase (short-subunit alcohol dehydrogenase family)